MLQLRRPNAVTAASSSILKTWAHRSAVLQPNVLTAAGSAHTLWSSPSSSALLSAPVVLTARQFSSDATSTPPPSTTTAPTPTPVPTPSKPPATRQQLDGMFLKLAALRKEAINLSYSQGPLTSWQRDAPSYLASTNPRWDSLRKESDALFVELRGAIAELRVKYVFVKDLQWEQLFSYLKVLKDPTFTWNFYNAFKTQIVRKLAFTESMVKKHSTSESKEAVATALDSSLLSRAQQVQPAPNVLALMFECMSFAVTGDQNTKPANTQKNFDRELEWMRSTPYLRIIFAFNPVIYNILFSHYIAQKIQPQINEIQTMLLKCDTSQTPRAESIGVASHAQERTRFLLSNISKYVANPQSFPEKNDFSYSIVMKLYAQMYSSPHLPKNVAAEIDRNFDAFMKQMNADTSFERNHVLYMTVAQIYLLRLKKMDVGSLEHQQLYNQTVATLEELFDSKPAVFLRNTLISVLMNFYSQYDQVDKIHQLLVRALHFDANSFDEYRTKILEDASIPRAFSREMYYNKKQEWKDNSKQIRSRHSMEDPPLVLDNILFSQFLSLVVKSPILRLQTPSGDHVSSNAPAEGLNKYVKFAATLTEWLSIRKKQLQELQAEAQTKYDAEVAKKQREDPSFKADFIVWRFQRQTMSLYELSDSVVTSYAKLITNATSVSSQDYMDFWKSIDVIHKRASPQLFTVMLNSCIRSQSEEWARRFATEIIAELFQLKLTIDDKLAWSILKVFAMPLPIMGEEFQKFIQPVWTQIKVFTANRKKTITPDTYRLMISIYAKISQQQQMHPQADLPSADECRSRYEEILNEMYQHQYDVSGLMTTFGPLFEAPRF